MSDSESSSSYFGLEDPRWLCMVTLFFASLVTLILYFVQYFQQSGAGNKRPAAAGDDAAKEEAAALLGWALSLRSWRSQWRGAWCRALNERSERSGVSVSTSLQPSNNTHVTSCENPFRFNEISQHSLVTLLFCIYTQWCNTCAILAFSFCYLV